MTEGEHFSETGLKNPLETHGDWLRAGGAAPYLSTMSAAGTENLWAKATSANISRRKSARNLREIAARLFF